MGALDFATTLLNLGSNALRELYHPEVFDTSGRFGGTLNRLVKLSKRMIEGDGVTIQVVDAQVSPGRFSRDINGAWPRPRAISTAKYKVNLTESTDTNDVSSLKASVSFTDLDLQRAAKSQVAAVDWVKRNFDGAVKHIGETTAVHMHLTSTARVATVDGTAKKADRRDIDSCAALTTTGGARFRVTSGSIAALPKGLLLDVYSSAGVFRFTVMVMDKNPRDNSVAVYGVNADDVESSSIDISTIVTTDELYISGEKGKGMISLGEWFSKPTAATGDDFFGKNREDPDFTWMQPHYSGPASSRAFDPTDIDTAGIELGYIEEDPEAGYIATAQPELIETYKRAIGANVLIQYPTNKEKGEIIASYGFDGAMHRHENLGRVMLQPDALHKRNCLRLLRPGDWERLKGLNEAWRWLPGDGGTGHYYRVESDTPGTGRSSVWRADGYGLFVDICLAPWRQIEIQNILPTATVSDPS